MVAKANKQALLHGTFQSVKLTWSSIFVVVVLFHENIADIFSELV